MFFLSSLLLFLAPATPGSDFCYMTDAFTSLRIRSGCSMTTSFINYGLFSENYTMLEGTPRPNNSSSQTILLDCKVRQDSQLPCMCTRLHWHTIRTKCTPCEIISLFKFNSKRRQWPNAIHTYLDMIKKEGQWSCYTMHTMTPIPYFITL